MNMQNKFDLLFPEFLLKDRISVALNLLGLNEFYIAFKYSKHLIASIILNKNDSKAFIKDEISKIANNYGNAEQTVKTGICKLYDMCNKELLSEVIPSGRKKLNYLERIILITEFVLKEINVERPNWQ